VNTLLQGLQERTAHAFPALFVDRRDGWWLRYADSAAWWSSVVLPHAAADPAELPGRIRDAEEFYAAHGGPPGFQLTPGVAPDGLDDALAARGYRVSSPMSLRTAVVADVIERCVAADSPARVDERPDEAWFETWRQVQGGGGEPGPEWALLGRVTRPSGYASVVTPAGVVAVGRTVVEDGWAGVFGMATRPEARGRGAARAVLAALAGWAATHGAGHLYLQVERANTAAGRLYEGAGFIEVCAYHYRTAPARP
jgi:GNAT superfamily N-acetyltransferase